MKFNLNKTLEQLEKDYWSEPDYDSYLVKTCHVLRKKPLQEFEIEDLRIMIGQNISLEYLVPLAIDKLAENIFTEGHMYEGDLLKSILTSQTEFWKQNKNHWESLCNIFRTNMEFMKTRDELHWDTKKEMVELFGAFEKINTTHT